MDAELLLFLVCVAQFAFLGWTAAAASEHESVAVVIGGMLQWLLMWGWFVTLRLVNIRGVTVAWTGAWLGAGLMWSSTLVGA